MAPQKVFTFILFLSLSFGCKAQQSTDTLSATGVIHSGIPVAAGGCGPTISIKSEEFKVEGLPKSFLIDKLKVKINYIKGSTFYCGRGRSPIETIRITEIEKVK